MIWVDFDWPDELEALRDEAAEVAERACAGRPLLEDSWVIGNSAEFSRELGARGWLGMTWPIDEGGHGRTALERFVVTEQLIASGAPLARSWVGDRQIGPTLLAFGSPQQRRQHLPAMVDGSACWCIGLSEPDAGSDLASVSTRATRVGDEYVVEGRKLWTSFGSEADHCYLIARTEADGPAHSTLSELLVDMSLPGISVTPIADMTGASHFCEVLFDGARVPADQLVGHPGEAFKQVMRQLEHERGGVDRLVSNRALYLDALARADTTDPLVRQEVAELETGYRLGRLLVLREVLDQAPPAVSAAVKVFCTEHEQRVASFAARSFGPDAMLWGRTARAACYAPAYSIQGGMNPVLRNVLAERALGLPR